MYYRYGLLRNNVLPIHEVVTKKNYVLRLIMTISGLYIFFFTFRLIIYYVIVEDYEYIIELVLSRSFIP